MKAFYSDNKYHESVYFDSIVDNLWALLAIGPALPPIAGIIENSLWGYASMPIHR